MNGDSTTVGIWRLLKCRSRLEGMSAGAPCPYGEHGGADGQAELERSGSDVLIIQVTAHLPARRVVTLVGVDADIPGIRFRLGGTRQKVWSWWTPTGSRGKHKVHSPSPEGRAV